MSTATPDGPQGNDDDIDRAFQQIIAGWDADAPPAATAPTPAPHPERSDAEREAPVPPAAEDPELPQEFVAPTPPPLRAVRPRAAVAWLLILSAPTVLLILGFSPVELTRFRVGLISAAFALGCLLALTQLRDREDDPPPDDGAVT